MRAGDDGKGAPFLQGVSAEERSYSQSPDVKPTWRQRRNMKTTG